MINHELRAESLFVSDSLSLRSDINEIPLDVLLTRLLTYDSVPPINVCACMCGLFLASLMFFFFFFRCPYNNFRPYLIKRLSLIKNVPSGELSRTILDLGPLNPAAEQTVVFTSWDIRKFTRAARAIHFILYPFLNYRLLYYSRPM